MTGAGCKCDGLPPCMNSQTSGNNGCQADYNNGSQSQSKGRNGGCASCSSASNAQPPPSKCKPPKTPQARPDPAQSLFDRYNMTCPGQPKPPQESGPQCSTGRKLKKHKNGDDLYDNEIPRMSC